MNDHEEFEPQDEPTTDKPQHAHLIFTVLPFLILFFVLGAMALLFLKSEQKTPQKRTAAQQLWYEGKPCDGQDCSQQVGNIATTWLRCNAGMEVTDLRNCPEYKVKHDWHDFTGFGHGKPKHKRRTYTEAESTTDNGRFTSGTIPISGFQWTSVESPAEEMILRSDNGNSVHFAQYDRDGKVYGITTEGFKCQGSFGPQPGPDDFRPASFNIACIEQPPAGSDEAPWRIIDPHTAIDSNGRVLQDDRRLAGDGGGLIDSKSASDKPLFTATGELDANGVLWHSDGSYECYSASGMCVSPTAAEIEAHKPKKPLLHRRDPDCTMPADVDVCPVQMIDPKGRHE